MAGGGGVISWSPAELPGCLLWLDAADDTVLSAPGGSLQQWDDKCASHSATGNGGTRPQLVPQSLNGKSGVEFDGADDFLEIGGASVDASAFTLFFVMKRGTSTGFVPVWSNRGLVIAPNTPTFVGLSNGQPYLFQDNATPKGFTALTIASSEAITYELWVDGAGRRILVNGAVVVSDNTQANTATSVPIGFLARDKPLSAHHAMMLFEVIMYTPALTSENAAIVRTKLSEKWALP